MKRILSAAVALAAAAGSALAGTDIRRADGGVEVFLPSLAQWQTVHRVPYGLQPGDRVRLRPRSTTELRFEDGSDLTLSEDAAFTLIDDDERGVIINLESGKVEADVTRYRQRVFVVKTPAGDVSMRNDQASVTVVRKTTRIEVWNGLAHFEGTAGAVQVPEGHRLEVQPGRAPGLPVPIPEWNTLKKLSRTGAPAAGRKLQRAGDVTTPVVGAPPPKGDKPEGGPPLGADSMGLPREASAGAAPALGAGAVGVDPSLGLGGLGMKDPKDAKAAEPALGHRSLGLKEPPPDVKAKPRAEAKPVKPAPATLPPSKAREEAPKPYVPMKIDTDISPRIDFEDYGLKAPKPRPEPAAEPKKAAAPKAAPAKAPPAKKAEAAKPKSAIPVRTDMELTSTIDFEDFGVKRPEDRPRVKKAAPKKK